MDGSTFSIKFFAAERSFSSLSEDFKIGSRSSIPNICIERSEMEFLRTFGVTAGRSGGRSFGFESSTLMLLTSDEVELTKSFISVSSRLMSLTDTKLYCNTGWEMTWRVLL